MFDAKKRLSLQSILWQFVFTVSVVFFGRHQLRCMCIISKCGQKKENSLLCMGYNRIMIFLQCTRILVLTIPYRQESFHFRAVIYIESSIQHPSFCVTQFKVKKLKGNCIKPCHKFYSKVTCCHSLHFSMQGLKNFLISWNDNFYFHLRVFLSLYLSILMKLDLNVRRWQDFPLPHQFFVVDKHTLSLFISTCNLSPFQTYFLLFLHSTKGMYTGIVDCS